MDPVPAEDEVKLGGYFGHRVDAWDEQPKTRNANSNGHRVRLYEIIF